MQEALRKILVLGLLAAGAGALLAWFADFTADDIRRNRQAAEARVLRELAGAPVAATEGDLLLCEQGLVILRSKARGYGGPLHLVVALEADGAVAGVRVLEHAETPGFADILAAGSAWLSGFENGNAGAVDAVTGATVTSNAVLAAVAAAVERHGVEAPCG